MAGSATEGTHLAQLVRLAIPLFKKADNAGQPNGPGAPRTYDSWQVAVLIMVGVLVRRKSKSAQYRYLFEHRKFLMDVLGMGSFPSRSTYFQRYAPSHAVVEHAVRLQGLKAISEGTIDATTVAVDKSLIRARGPAWYRRNRRRAKRPRGVDPDANWGYSEYHGWVYGYSYEVVVTAGKGLLVFPLQLSSGPGNVSESISFGPKVDHLPSQTRYVLADAGYDSNAIGERVEYHEHGSRTGRRFVCPFQARFNKPAVGRCIHRGKRERSRQRRAKRFAFYSSPRGRRLHTQRSRTVEPFNEWFKGKFELRDRTWHRGLGNNRTQLAAAMFVYQLLIRFHCRKGGTNGSIQWILDTL